MIHSLSSDLPSFKRLTLSPGLNILLAEKSAGATDRQTRNGAGKTSFVELINFLFAGNCGPDSIFRSAELVSSTFACTVDIGGETVRVARSGAKPSRICVEGDSKNWPVPPSLDRKIGLMTLSNENWRSDLGALLFGLPIVEGDDSDGRFAPTFRSLFGYFARRQNSGGFQAPAQQSSMQQPWDQQVAVSFLLGLDASIPQRFQEVRKRESAMSELRKAAKEGSLGRYFGTAADLRTRLTVADARAGRLREQVTTFTVVPEYSALEREASITTRDISTLNDENTADRELILQLQEAIESERPPSTESLDRLYREAGVVLPQSVSRRFEEVQEFHLSIVQNRRSHLSAEVRSAEERIRGRDRKREGMDVRRRQVMGILQSGGALEHFSRLQEEVGRTEADVEGLRQRLAVAEKIESTKAEIDIERAGLLKLLQDDHHERAEVIREAILVFEDLSNALYEKAGSLTVSARPNGPEVDVRIDAQRSKGITNMQIFCFDLMLAELATRRGIGPGFLVHDSHLFDGVDERQVAKALQLGADHAQAIGFQYIVTMNSDALPKDGFREGFDIDAYLLDTRLTDATESGGLFGLRFS
jgi:uncharacterized protein YydD (DUF2326 family)